MKVDLNRLAVILGLLGSEIKKLSTRHKTADDVVID